MAIGGGHNCVCQGGCRPASSYPDVSTFSIFTPCQHGMEPRTCGYCHLEDDRVTQLLVRVETLEEQVREWARNKETHNGG